MDLKVSCRRRKDKERKGEEGEAYRKGGWTANQDLNYRGSVR